jgi:digeranylgeranylglycerophospholipid reductase
LGDQAEVVELKNYDLLVVGAGPSGATVAKVAAKNGLNILLIEKVKEGGPRKACGGIVRGFYGKEIPKNLVDHELLGMIIYSPSGNTAEVRLTEPCLVIAREKLDSWMAQQAVEKGATFEQGTSARKFIRRGDFIKVELKRESRSKVISCRAVVGADGALSTVARSFGLVSRTSPEDYIYCYEYFVKMDAKLIEDNFSGFSEVFYSTKYAKGFYSWLEPAGTCLIAGTGCVGSPVLAKSSLEEFVRKHPGAIKKVQGTIVQRKAGIIWLKKPKRTYAKQALLVGDAAGMVSPFTGEGIHFAIQSGRIAGDVLSEILSKGRPRTTDFQLYEQRWKKEFWREQRRDVDLRNRFMQNDERLEMLVKFLGYDCLNRYVAQSLSSNPPGKLDDLLLQLKMGLKTLFHGPRKP